MKIGYHKPIERPKSALFLGDAPRIIFGAR